MSEGIMEINPLMPYEDIRADRLSVPAVGLGLAALAKGVSQNTLNRTTDTPSGKVFAPTGETIEPTRLPGMAPAEKLKGLPGLLGIELAKKLEGMSQASPTPKNKGFTTPASEDMKILHNVEEGEPKFKYPTTEELKSYIKKTNKFYEEEVIPKANEKRPKLNIKNLPKIVDADKHFGAAAMASSNYSESQLIYMSPQKYLDLTKRFRPVGTQGEGSKLKSDNIEQLLKDGKELANIPFLNVTKVGDGYKVTNQEGIHRAIAFKNLGYDKMPVVIRGTGIDKVAGVENKVYTATPKSYLYTEPWAKDYIGFIPKSIQSDDEALLTKPEDFYNVRTKEKLFNGETKNQIKTWETMGNFKNIEEAKQRSEKAGIPFDEVESAGLKQQITFKKARNTEGYDVFFDKKLIGNLDDITREVVERDGKRERGMRTFNLGILNSDGITETADTYEGVEQSKEMITKMIARELLTKDSKTQYGSGLRKIFEDTKYDQKGYPIVEEYKIETKDLGGMSPLEQEAVKQTLNKDVKKKAYGGLIGKPLSGGSRYI
jgi:hypothetical protein